MSPWGGVTAVAAGVSPPPPSCCVTRVVQVLAVSGAGAAWLLAVPYTGPCATSVSYVTSIPPL